MKAVLIIVCLVVFAVPACLQALEVYPVQKVLLPNGMTIVAKVDKRTDLVAVHTFVASGYSADPKGKEGLAQLVFGAMSEGPAGMTREEFDSKLSLLAGMIDLRCEKETSYIQSQVLSECLPGILELHAQLMKTPKFEKKLLEQCKSRSVSKIETSRRHPRAEGYLKAEARALLFGEDHPYGKLPYGKVESIRNIKVNDLKKFHKEHFCANQIAVSIVGNFELSVVVKQIMNLYSSVKASRTPVGSLLVPDAPVPVNKPVEEYRAITGLKNTHACIGFHAPSIEDDDFHAMTIIKSLLAYGSSSILKKVFDDRGYSKDFEADYSGTVGVSDFTICFSSKNSFVDLTVSGVLGELEKLKRNPVSVDVLNRARRMIKNKYGFDSSSRLFQSYISGKAGALNQVAHYESFFQLLDKVTPDDVMNAAKKYFGLDKYVLLVLSPEEESVQRKSTVSTKVLANGLKILVKPEPGDNAIGITFGLRGGSYMDPKGKEGLNALLFKTLERCSTKTNPDGRLKVAFEDLGGTPAFLASHDTIGIVGTTTRYFLDEYVDLVTELYTEPKLDGGNFKVARRELLGKLDYMKSSPSDHMNQLITEAVFNGHVLGSPLFGTRKSLRNITADDLKDFHKKYFVPSNTIISVVGDISPERVFRLMEKKLGSLPSVKVTIPEIPTFKGHVMTDVLYLPEEGTRTGVGFAFVVPDAFEKFASFAVVGNICGWGRECELYEMLHDNGFDVKKLQFDFRLKGGMGVAVFYGAVEGGDPSQLPELVKKLAKSIGSRKYTDLELKITRRKLATVLAMLNENRAGQSVNILWSDMYAPDPLFVQRIPELYKGVTKESVQKVARKYFKNYQLLITGGKK